MPYSGSRWRWEHTETWVDRRARAQTWEERQGVGAAREHNRATGRGNRVEALRWVAIQSPITRQAQHPETHTREALTDGEHPNDGPTTSLPARGGALPPKRDGVRGSAPARDATP
jgi:hypothetical protein